jgi:methylenetetrahydrofolate dehydrogenase (NADP+)/methenyltetrahydrofolate cyclohydrolase
LVLGKPLAMMLLQNQATVSIGHSKTINLTEFTNSQDIVVTGIGKAKYFNHDYFNESTTIIDVGINFNEQGLCGDVDYDSVVEKVMAITPVPGGVGAVTSMMLFMNLLKAIKLQFN